MQSDHFYNKTESTIQNDEFKHIASFQDQDVAPIIKKHRDNKLFNTLLDYGFPNMSEDMVDKLLDSCHCIKDFQSRIILPMLERLLQETSSGLSYEGTDQLDANKSYLFISNHRDIVLDTCLTNYVLLQSGKPMTASAIGDNLVKDPFLHDFAKMNRNFLVLRGLSARETLKSSHTVSNYIQKLLFEDTRSVWIAQREGRTKNGHDLTQAGVLKMIALARTDGVNPLDYLQSIEIVPVAISYEYDPTDILKVPELIAKKYGQEYKKQQAEDFQNIITGAIGQKNSIHIAFGKPIQDSFEKIDQGNLPINQQFQQVAKLVDLAIYDLYKLWPSHYVAHDLLENSNQYQAFYTEAEKDFFVERLQKIVLTAPSEARELILHMYANPVKNKAN